MANTFWARVTDGVVAEVIALPSDLHPDDAFAKPIAAALVQCDAAVGPHWAYDGTSFAAPSAPTLEPVIRVCAGTTLVKALTDKQWSKVKPRDQACIAVRVSLPETLDMIVRAATAAGTTPKAWFDIALGGS